jgi:hypothetical protein
LGLASRLKQSVHRLACKFSFLTSLTVRLTAEKEVIIFFIMYYYIIIIIVNITAKIIVTKYARIHSLFLSFNYHHHHHHHHINHLH